MKANELMIRDWVYIEEGDELGKTQVVCISEDNTDWLHPIPLTPEILEKNGWVFIEGQDYSTFPVPSKWVNQSVPFALRVDGETYSIAYIFTIKYIHELQNALRLCGLNELADNLKV